MSCRKGGGRRKEEEGYDVLLLVRPESLTGVSVVPVRGRWSQHSQILPHSNLEL